jgi:hypothetical protein
VVARPHSSLAGCLSSVESVWFTAVPLYLFQAVLDRVEAGAGDSGGLDVERLRIAAADVQIDAEQAASRAANQSQPLLDGFMDAFDLHAARATDGNGPGLAWTLLRYRLGFGLHREDPGNGRAAQRNTCRLQKFSSLLHAVFSFVLDSQVRVSSVVREEGEALQEKSTH